METHEPVGDGRDAGGGGLPLLRARTWAIGFLLVAIALAIVFSLTMADLFRAAYHL
ncbi:MAG TPA: hypothetical protein VGD53_35535 [Actinoallomurus sp.]|jgi:hypothetical protein